MKKTVLISALPLMLTVASSAVSAAPISNCGKIAQIDADFSGYPRGSPEWQESYDLAWQTCYNEEHPDLPAPTPCKPVEINGTSFCI